MNEKDDFALVPSQARTLGKTAPGGRPILSGMVTEMLALHKDSFGLTEKRFRIGDYEWCEPDYRQILQWANALRMEPVMVIERLLASRPEWPFVEDLPFWAATRMEGGRFVSLLWNLELLPLRDFELINGIAIKSIFLLGPTRRSLTRVLITKIHIPALKLLQFGTQSLDISKLDLADAPNLTELACVNSRWVNPVNPLDLSCVPNLTILDCSNSQLSALDISNVPKLSSLKCSENLLAELDISKTQNLTELNCYQNQLPELDLSNVPNLRSLDCDFNQLANLDVSRVPNLTRLSCSHNRFSRLNLSNLPKLSELLCQGNQLSELDLSKVQSLKWLNCRSNRLAALDLSNLPNLAALVCANNQLSELDLANLPHLRDLRCSRNRLGELDIRPLNSVQMLLYDKANTHLIRRPDQVF